uniref:Armadillo repeat-containing protein 1 n=1 Tax=Caenorhabditis tropicalis TaxID=1561998 RepID=A0A1I7USV9_9PELO
MTPSPGKYQASSYTIEVLPAGCSNARYTTILHYPHWPKGHVAPSAKVVLKGIQALDPSDKVTKGKCLVHSAEGINRAMTVVLVDYVIDLMFRNNTVDVPELITQLRSQRGGAFQNRIFCIYALYVVIDYVKIRLTKFQSAPDVLAEINVLQKAMRKEFDKTFFNTLPTLLKDDSSDVIRYAVKILVLLTEQSENIEQLLKSTELLPSLSEACENITNPSVNYNLVLVSSRIRAVKNSLEAKRAAQKEPLADAVKELDKGGTLHRKFVGRKSKQVIMEFDADEFDETKKREVERILLKKKGVISVYITEHNSIPRAVLRTIPTIEAKEIAVAVFNAGFEYIAQIVKVDGNEEKFEMYASEIQKGGISGEFPEYLDDDVLNVDPASCVITNEMAKAGGQEGGWFSSITSFVKTSLW